jgi:hypothetical protein
MKQGKIEEAKRHIDLVLDLYVSLARKGCIQTKEADVGFVDGRAIFIDLWHFRKTGYCPIVQRIRYESCRSLRPFECWLQKTYPQLGDYYRQRIVKLLTSVV